MKNIKQKSLNKQSNTIKLWYCGRNLVGFVNFSINVPLRTYLFSFLSFVEIGLKQWSFKDFKKSAEVASTHILLAFCLY